MFSTCLGTVRLAEILHSPIESVSDQFGNSRSPERPLRSPAPKRYVGTSEKNLRRPQLMTNLAYFTSARKLTKSRNVRLRRIREPV